MPSSPPPFVARNRELAAQRDEAIAAGDDDLVSEIEQQLREHNRGLVVQVAERLADDKHSVDDLRSAGEVSLRGIIRRMPSPLLGEVGPHVVRSVRERLERRKHFS